MNHRNILALLIGLAFVGCSAGSRTNIMRTPFELKIEDEASDSRFRIELLSHSSEALCLERYAWPSDDGVPSTVVPATLSFDKGSVNSRGYNPPQCTGGCMPRIIKPYGRLVGFIRYDAFGDPELIKTFSGRKLKFEVEPKTCSAEMMPSETLESTRIPG